jgi:iron(III) transport system substrate-binding protein
MSPRSSLKTTLLALLLASTAASAAMGDAVVNVYSYRQPQLLEPLFKDFQAKTGIEVKMVFAEKGLVERLEQEGSLSPADLLLSADVGKLVEASGKGLAQAVTSPTIDAAVPANLRDAGHTWFGLTQRGRVIYASVDRVKQDTISYEELADPKWKGRICTRPGSHPYNLGLLSFVIAKKGEEFAKTWIAGVKANLVAKPNGNDRAQAKSIAAGECDLAIANTYYMGLMTTNEKEPEQKDWAKAAKILFPSSPELGTHVNISGMMLTKSAPNKDNALKLMEYLASDAAQSLYAAGNFEYPVNPAVAPIELVKSWGALKPDALPVVDVAKNIAAASKMMEDVGFDN